MGASQSIPSTLTREKVFELTRSTRGMMNVLLDYMLKEVTVRDFLALSNPAECKKYVLFMANNLHKHFYELQIVPTKSKQGVIAFRTVKELINPPEESDNERQSLCLTLAYFYTRIFQIYGALALTLIDDSRYMIESGIIPKYGDTTSRGLLPPGYRPYTSIGGVISASSLGYFNFLRNYLFEDREGSKGFLTRYIGEDDTRGVVYFTPHSLKTSAYGIGLGSEIESKVQKGVFSIGYFGAKKYATLDVFAKIDGIGGDIKFTFGKLQYTKKQTSEIQTTELSSSIISPKTITIVRTRPIEGVAYIYSIKDTDLTISDYFNDIFSRIIPYLKRLVEGNSLNIVRTPSGIPSEVGTAEELRLARIIQNLTKTKPLGHCMARALQLLKNIPFKGEPGISQICKPKFFEQVSTSPSGSQIITSRSGIPEPGSSLDSSPGMSALSQLFYDTIIIGSPRIIIGQTPGPGGQPSSLQQYLTFMRNMARIYGDDKDTLGRARSNNSLKQSGLKGIKNRRDKDLCDGITTDILVSPSIIGNVYDVVNQLYRTQIEHAAKCGKIFNMLFNIQIDKSSGNSKISLSDNIIKKGFPEIERINYLARDVLMEYYTNCELKYLQGMKIILDSKKRSETITSNSLTTTS